MFCLLCTLTTVVRRKQHIAEAWFVLQARLERALLDSSSQHDVERAILLYVFWIVFLIPFYLIIRNALMTNNEITSFEWKWLPIPMHWENVGALFNDGGMGRG